MASCKWLGNDYIMIIYHVERKKTPSKNTEIAINLRAETNELQYFFVFVFWGDPTVLHNAKATYKSFT